MAAILVGMACLTSDCCHGDMIWLESITIFYKTTATNRSLFFVASHLSLYLS